MFGIDDIAIAAGANLLSQAPQMLFNARQAAINRDWQESMANSQIQRRVADANAAGINPIFAVAGGSGAAVGGGAQATVGPGGDVLSSAKQAAVMSSQVRQAKAEADAAVTNADTALQTNARAHVDTQNWLQNQESLYAATNARNLADRAQADADATAARIERGIDTEHGVGLRYTNRLMGNAPASSAASVLRLLK